MRWKRVYWSCQLGAWSLYGLAVGAPYVWMGTVPVGRMIPYAVALSALGLVQTHALRRRAKARGWPHLSFARLAPRVLASSAVMGAVMNTFMVLAALFWFRHSTWRELRVGWQIVTWAWWFFPAFVGWQSLYFGVHFIERARRAEIEQWQLRAEAHAAELRFLRAQLNPHFLFNALNSLRGLIGEDPDRAIAMVTRLSSFLRSSLSSAQGTVSLEREISLVNDYLALEGLRLEQRLRVTMDIDPHALPAAVPPMLVQGLVENGIKHGIARLPGGGTLALEARMTRGVLAIHVTSPRAPAAEDADDEDGGIGLVNARQRLRLHFGEHASLELDAREDTITARVHIPTGSA